MIRKGLRPGFRIVLDSGKDRDGYRRVWRFRRSWIAIAVLLVMDLIFLLPAVLTFNQAAGEWSRLNSLFDLVGAVFLSAWLLGWSVAPLLMTGVLVLMLFGRETLTIRPGTVELVIGLPFFGVASIYDVSKMRNLRLEQPAKKSGSSWRGKHFQFDYGANTVGFGSDVDGGEITEVRNGIHTGSGIPVRRGDATPAELEGTWKEASEADSKAPAENFRAASEPVTWTSASTIALVIANLVPVAGTLFMGWNLSDLLVLYWAESAIIGLFNIGKIITIGRWGAVLAVPFFAGHFGGFMAVHFLFIYTIFVKGINGMNDSAGDLAEVAQLFFVLWPALVALFFSHAYSFFTNFLGRGEQIGRTVKDQMSEPYSRIIFMHFVLILGGALTLVLGQAEPVLLAVIGLKVYFDVRAHLREHAPALPR